MPGGADGGFVGRVDLLGKRRDNGLHGQKATRIEEVRVLAKVNLCCVSSLDPLHAQCKGSSMFILFKFDALQILA